MRSLNLWASRKMNGSRSSSNYAERAAKLVVDGHGKCPAKLLLGGGCPRAKDLG
jgi:hypothetical protein